MDIKEFRLYVDFPMAMQIFKFDVVNCQFRLKSDVIKWCNENLRSMPLFLLQTNPAWIMFFETESDMILFKLGWL